MDEINPRNILDFIRRTDGTVIERRDLHDIVARAVVRAATDKSIWLIEVTGRDKEGCVEGLLTFVSEIPLSHFGLIQLPDLRIIQVPAVIGGYLSEDHNRLDIGASLPGRSPQTDIIIGDITSLMCFDPETM